MAGAKETPRQKMIGMMYLVLTALLALNVSADLLNAFVIVNEAMDKTNLNFQDKNQSLYKDFQDLYNTKPDKVKVWWEKAQQVQKLSADLINQIHDVQNQVIGYSEFDNRKLKGTVEYTFINTSGDEEKKSAKEPRLVPLSSVITRDNFDKPMEVLLGFSEDGTTGEAAKIKTAIIKYREKLAEIIDSVPANRKNTIERMGFNLEPRYNPKAGKEQNWELNNFAHSPLAADMILLNKLIADIQNVEAETVKQLKSNITDRAYNFDNLTAAVIPTSGTVLVSGQPFEADIFIAANSSNDKPQVYIGSQKLDNIVNGVAKYKANTGGVGEQKFAGVIKVTNDKGETTDYPFSSSYMVIKPTATVSADKMNVVYQTLENPITISAPGFTNDKLKLSVTGNGTLKNAGNGKYLYIPSNSTADITFTVTGTTGEGKSSNLGAFKYRVKPMPASTTRLASAGDGESIDRSKIVLRPIVTATYDNFLFDGLEATVTKFNISAYSKKGSLLDVTVNSNRLPGDIVETLRSAPAGTKISISSIFTSRGRGIPIVLTIR